MNNVIDTSLYLRIANAILLRRYDEHNMTELINAILFLLKADETHKEFLVRFVKTRVNNRIKESIANMNDIYEILLRFLRIMNIHNLRNTRVTQNNRVNRNNNQQRNNRNRNNNRNHSNLNTN